ncbi:MAG: MFS transporter [Sporomusaceae bacterium]|nr:MFS transporter [Sporomusaceae bacterium]
MIENKSGPKIPLAIVALLISAFSIGTTEFVIMGILLDVATDLQVSISAAGLLISGYAIGVALGGPVITFLTRQLPRKKLLFRLMLVFIAGNVLAVVAPNYTVLMAARIVASFTHGTFFGVGSVVATRLVKQEQQSRAVAMMFAGLTLANILGVPLGTYIGHNWGWRMTFGFVSLLGGISLGGIALLIPHLEPDKPASLSQELQVLYNKQVILALLMTVLGFGGVFTAFTYIAPLLTDITGFSEAAITPILLLFGLGMTIGNLIGGKLSDWKLMPSLAGMLLLLAAILAGFTFTSHEKWAALLTIFLWGIAAFAIVPALQMRVLAVAKTAPSIAAALNISSFNLGNAGGAFLGGLVINSSLGLNAIPMAAASVTFAGLMITLVSWSFDRKTTVKDHATTLDPCSRKA